MYSHFAKRLQVLLRVARRKVNDINFWLCVRALPQIDSASFLFRELWYYELAQVWELGWDGE